MIFLSDWQRNGCKSQAGISSGRNDERGARSARFLPVLMLPSLWVLIWVSHPPWIPTLWGRILRDGIFELKPKRWEFSPRKRFSGRRISRCQCPRGRQLGVVLEELTGAGGAMREGRAERAAEVGRGQIMQGLCAIVRHFRSLSALWKQ